jgi:anti-sigma regulatory factor (Ser/Thr protein kinase)
VSSAWSGPDGPRPGEAAVHRHGAGWLAPSVERNGGSGAGDEGRRQPRGGSGASGPHPGSRPHERRGREQGTAQTAVRLTPGSAAPRRAREIVASRLEGHIAEERAADAVLLVSELVTNSILHADLDEDGWIHLEVGVSPGAVRIDVSDTGRGFRAEGRERPSPDRVHGRGLFLVQALADRCGVAPGGSSRVWFELDR